MVEVRDYYLKNPPRQPKREIADYVASCGILVPPRFVTLAEALNSGGDFIARSEHPQDYAGSSGIVDSLFVTTKDLSLPPTTRDLAFGESAWTRFLEGEGDATFGWALTKSTVARLRDNTQADLELKITRLSNWYIDQHCRFTGEDKKRFLSELSYSYWQGLGGLNRVVVADSAIEGRYHIFSTLFVPKEGLMDNIENGYGYSILENGRVVAGGGSENLPEQKLEDFLSLVDFYESIRNLGRFDPKHCPIIEMQTFKGSNYFLQYHRGRDFNPSTFILDREPNQEEITAIFVRGCTPPEGLTLTVNMHWDESAPANEEAATDYNIHPLFTEAVIRQRRLQIIKLGHPGNLFNQDRGHSPRSKLFKPEISAVLLRKDYEERLTQGISYSRKNPMPNIKVHLVSDGRKAYIRRIQD